MHEAFGHLSESDFVYENPKAQEMMVLGRRFGPDNLTVFDDGSLPGLRGTHKYDDEGVKVRAMKYENVKQYGTHYVTTNMSIIPYDPEKKNNSTTIKILDIAFDQGISDSYFTKSALTRYSR